MRGGHARPAEPVTVNRPSHCGRARGKPGPRRGPGCHRTAVPYGGGCQARVEVDHDSSGQ
eukprot:767422-Hanusia_phi.AAC.4